MPHMPDVRLLNIKKRAIGQLNNLKMTSVNEWVDSKLTRNTVSLPLSFAHLHSHEVQETVPVATTHHRGFFPMMNRTLLCWNFMRWDTFSNKNKLELFERHF